MRTAVDSSSTDESPFQRRRRLVAAVTYSIIYCTALRAWRAVCLSSSSVPGKEITKNVNLSLERKKVSFTCWLVFFCVERQEFWFLHSLRGKKAGAWLDFYRLDNNSFPKTFNIQFFGSPWMRSSWCRFWVSIILTKFLDLPRSPHLMTSSSIGLVLWSQETFMIPVLKVDDFNLFHSDRGIIVKRR